MAMKKQNTSTAGLHTFQKGLGEDINGMAKDGSSWTQARNAVNNTTVGDVAELSNEESNYLCATAPYTIIGFIHLEADKWAVFSTDDSNSEIGLFERDSCTYDTVANDPCLNFNKDYLIIGVSRTNFDCDNQVYWSDSYNPDRTMSIQNPPWIQDCVDDNGDLPGGCIICTDTDQLDCEKLRIAALVKNICLSTSVGTSSGELLNGQYYVVGAYVINGQKILDYSAPSNVQGLFTHQNLASSLEVTVDFADEEFDEFELILISFSNFQTVGKRVGIYSTRQKVITIDAIIETWPDVDIGNIALRNPIFDKSDGIYKNGKYMMRIGPTNKFDFNYQPLANQIETSWVSIEYPADYYRKGGTKTSYMRDEVYSFFVRFVYNTGDKSASYHIPGRATNANDAGQVIGDDSAVDIADGLIPYTWRVYNTASINPSFPLSVLPDGGTILAGGSMGYWESSEYYDDDTPEIWNANLPGQPQFDLCGTPIRHHRFPENTIRVAPYTGSTITNHYDPVAGNTIRIMSVQFDNIQPPIDNDGNVIQNIVGYEILRGTREGNKTVLAKGLINNGREYDTALNNTPRQGIYANYPFNPLGPDKFLNAQHTNFVADSEPTYFTIPFEPYTGIRKDLFTFHSPETSFRDPYLSAKEIKIYGEANGTVNGYFDYPDKHPKHKFITDVAFAVSAIASIGYAVVKMQGKKTTNYKPTTKINLGGNLLGQGAGTISGPANSAAANTAVGLMNTTIAGGQTLTFGSLAAIATTLIGGETNNLQNITTSQASELARLAPGTISGYYNWSREVSENESMPDIFRVIQAVPTFLSYMGQGTDIFIELIRAFSPWRQYAMQYMSHGFYSRFRGPTIGNTKRGLGEQGYIDPTLQDFGLNYRINNIYRSRTVAIETTGLVANPLTVDNTQQTFSDATNFPNGPDWPNLSTDDKVHQKSFNTTASSHYVALKQRLLAQYGQIASIIQVPVSTCMVDIAETGTGPLFNGDVYIGRFTEKNTMFFFYDWLYDLPDGAEFDYRLYKMITHPRFWMDTESFDLQEFLGSLGDSVTFPAIDFDQIVVPSGKAAFDRKSTITGIFNIKNAFMYLFNSGVRDFFVESEINIDYRDWGDNDSQRHYDPYRYSDLTAIFNSNLIKAGNFFKYDYSLSQSKLFNNFIAWGNTQARSYDPTVAEDCYVYRPKRITYSLPQDLENQKDYWRVFLPFNYKDFNSKVTAIRPIGKNGAIMLFENESPVQFAGVDQLVTDSGTKVTIGDGGLFSQPLQNLANVDEPIEYGSCQNRLSIVNTPLGMFYMSQNQGKIMQVANGLMAISDANMKWWFATYLPYRLTNDFPDFELQDNPVVGIGCQSIYDNKNQIVYFSKKDYQLRKDIRDKVEYVSGRMFIVNNILPIQLGDPRYFEDASWTVSYDPKVKGFISYHDWHPDLTIPGKKTFMSSKDDGIWIHNDNCASYCNFYGTDYPFEVEFSVPTNVQVNTLRSLEYYMEVFKYDENCYDRFHVLDFNFDEAVVYNSEQVSGLLNLNLMPKNNAPEILNYPQINFNNIDILFSKEEQKYRINQFWDITDNRGEFDPTAERMIFNTAANGYVRTLNANNLNYAKFELEHKKFRHYQNTVLLRRKVSGNRNMVVSTTVNKNLLSPR